MREYIFTWDVKNISYSWHRKNQELVSSPFVAESLQNTVWTLILYPRGHKSNQYLSLYVCKSSDCPRINYTIECELSCVSANNLPLTSTLYYVYGGQFENGRTVGNPYFLLRRVVFELKKDLYIPQDTLKLRCRLWNREEGVDEFAQSFACTRLEIERVVSIEDMNPRINKNKKIDIFSKKEKTPLISIDVSQQKDCLRMRLHSTKNTKVKFSIFKFSAAGKSMEPCHFTSSWLGKPYKRVWRVPFSKNNSKISILNKLNLTCEFIYSTGEETKSVEKASPCSFKFTEFSTNTILSCIPSGKLFDCPNISKDLWYLYTNQILCDVELKTPTTSFMVHKVVLCARSPVFTIMFAHGMKEKMNNCVEIADLEDETLGNLVKFLYTDIFEESQWEAVLKLYYSAEKYQVKRLKILCGFYFWDEINDLNACELLELADEYNDDDLKWKVEDYIVKNYGVILRSNTWKQLSDNQRFLSLKSRKGLKEKIPQKGHGLSSSPTIANDLNSIYHSQVVIDIVIQTPNAKFPAHKAVLYAGSSTIRKILASDESPDTLKVEDLEDGIVAHLLLFLYTDILGDVKWEDVTKLYHAAVVYQIERLKIACSCFFLKKLDLSTARDLLQVAQKYRDTRLKSQVEEFLSLSNKDIGDFKVLEKGSDVDSPNQSGLRRSKRLKLECDI